MSDNESNDFYSDYKNSDTHKYSKTKIDNTYEMVVHHPPEAALNIMKNFRKFFEVNEMPFVVFPISNYKICVRNNQDIPEGSKRLLYKSIMKTTGINRKGNVIWDQDALCYYFDENYVEHIDVDFNLENIKKYYLEYKQMSIDQELKIDVEDWSDNLIKY